MCARGRVGSRRGWSLMRKPKEAFLRRWHLSKERKEVGGHYIAIWGTVFQDRAPILEGQLESHCGWIAVEGE